MILQRIKNLWKLSAVSLERKEEAVESISDPVAEVIKELKMEDKKKPAIIVPMEDPLAEFDN